MSKVVIRFADPAHDAAAILALYAPYIEKTYVIEEAGKLQSTFVYTSGSHRIDIVGVDVVDGSGTVVASDYHFGYSGGQKVNNVYTVRRHLHRTLHRYGSFF